MHPSFAAFRSRRRPRTLFGAASSALVLALALPGAVIPPSVVLASASGPSASRHSTSGARHGPPGYTLVPSASAGTQSSAPINATYTHTPAPDSTQNLPAGNGNIMPSATVYLVFWLGTAAGSTYEGSAAGDTNYESLIARFIRDLGGSQYHNLLTQYSGNNGTISNNVSLGGTWVDTTNAYPHTGSTADPLQDADITAEVARAVAANSWTEDLSHIVAVFTASGIQECNGGNCTFQGTNPFCAYHNHFSDSGTDTLYAFMSFDNQIHTNNNTCDSSASGADTDPNKFKYPNGDVSADSEINVLSHELIEAETDPQPNATWTGPNGEIGDACNFNFAPRSDTGADVYLNGHPYIVQQEWSNAASTCAIDLPTNGFCSGSVSNVCAPTTSYGKTVDDSRPQVKSQIHYTLTLNNSSDTAAETNLTVTDNLPAGYTVVSGSAPGSTSNSTTATSVTVNYDSLPVHQSRTIVITAAVPTQAGVTATNCGSLAGSDLLGTALAGQTTSPCASTTPIKIPTTVTYSGPTRGDYNDPVTLSAVLVDGSSNPVSGKTIDFSLNGAETCSGVTDTSGTARCSVTPGETPGSYQVIAAFSDGSDPEYAVSSTSAGFTVTQEETRLTNKGSLTVHYHDPVTVSAQLTDPAGGAGIGGKTVAFTLGGIDTCSSTTDSSGSVSCTIVPHQSGTQNLVASFAGDTYFLATSTTNPFATTPEETTINYTGPTTILAGASGATLSARLMEDGSNDGDGDGGSPAPIPAKRVALSVASQSCTGTTDTSGNVSCTIPSITVPLGPETVSASFAGDSYYQAATYSTSAIVFAFPSRGAFALGDKTVSTAGSSTVTWWSDTWSQLNSLSGGTAPSSFKGFAGTITLPTTTPASACGSNWTTGGGNSPPPTSGVPSYMGVIVPTKVAKSGTTIAGNSVHIVVVKVNPGYAPTPMNPGTGTVVATYC